MKVEHPVKILAFCILFLLLMTQDEGLAKRAEVEDYADDLEDGTYEQQSDADIFYEDALRHALKFLWTQRFHISRANFHLISILGRNASETIKFGEQLRTIRDVIERKSEQLREKILGRRLTLNEMTSEPIIEQEILDLLIRTWKRVTKVFDLNPPQTSTLEFSTTYKWMQNIENNTYQDYKKVNWLITRIRKMRPVNQC